MWVIVTKHGAMLGQLFTGLFHVVDDAFVHVSSEGLHFWVCFFFG